MAVRRVMRILTAGLVLAVALVWSLVREGRPSVTDTPTPIEPQKILRRRACDGGHGNLPIGGHRISPLAVAGSPRPWPSVLPAILS